MKARGRFRLTLPWAAMAPAFLVLALLLPTAHAGDAPALCLPANEVAAAWTTPAERAGLRVSASDAAPRVEVHAAGAGWELRAVGADGRVRTATIPAPRTLAEREDAALLAASLLRRSTVTGLVDWAVPERPAETRAAGASASASAPAPAPARVGTSVRAGSASASTSASTSTSTVMAST